MKDIMDSYKYLLEPDKNWTLNKTSIVKEMAIELCSITGLQVLTHEASAHVNTLKEFIELNNEYRELPTKVQDACRELHGIGE